MKVAIGPISGWYGGAAQHIINIMHNSKITFSPITIPTIIRAQSWLYRKTVYPISKKHIASFQHNVLRFDMYGIQRHWDFIGKLMARHIDNNYDVVHLHGHPYWHNIYSHDYKNSIYTVHNLYRKDDFSPTWYPTINMLTESMINFCNKSKKVISVAEWLQRELKYRHNISSTYIPNGVNLNEVSKGSAKRFRQKFKIDDDFFLFVGRATKYKRPELFVELARSLPDKLFVMIGRGLTTTEFMRYQKIEIPDNILLLGEPTRKDVIDAFSACRVFVLTSANETFGIVILEAMSSFKPVVAANNFGPKEIIQEGETGFLFDCDSLSSLREKALIAWKASSSMGDAGRALVEKMYDWKKIVPKIEEVYSCIK